MVELKRYRAGNVNFFDQEVYLEIVDLKEGERNHQILRVAGEEWRKSGTLSLFREIGSSTIEDLVLKAQYKGFFYEFLRNEQEEAANE
jgi:hypothetical protein